LGLGAGKRGAAKDGSPVFLAAPYQMGLNAVVSQLAKELAVDGRVLAAIRAGWEREVPAGMLSILVGPMASGSSVIADPDSAEVIGAQHKELIAIEMEGYAVMAAAEYSPTPKPIAIIIKSVCDFANPDKNDDWQSYAAYTSAAFAHQLFQNPNFAYESEGLPKSGQ
jgi:nucleoside phosphorylase